MPADTAGPAPMPPPSGVIHDLGYRRYDGQRLGRVQIARALAWHSLRSAFGIGRGVKAKLAAFVLACLIMIEVPLLLLYLGTVLQAHGFSAIWAQTRALTPGLLLGLLWA